MIRAVIDQDITPTDRLVEQLPDDWDVSVGIESTEDEAIATLEDATIVFVTSRVPLTPRVLAALDDLEIIAKLGTGLDSVAVDVARERGIEVTYTPGMNAQSVAEHTVMLALATARRLTQARRLIENGQWRDDMPLGNRLLGSTVGIIGFGNVGKRVGSILNGFNVDLLLSDPYVPEIDAELVGGTNVSLEELLERSDIVCVTAEHTEETRGLIGRAELERMQSSALLVNAARGPIVAEALLIDALADGTISGAGMDVHQTEPLDPDSPLLEMDNVVLTPHVASMTMESRQETIDRLVTNVLSLRDGTVPADRYLAPSDGSTLAE